MATTLALADDVEGAVRAIAAREGCSVGDIVSDMVRQTLRRHEPVTVGEQSFPVLPYRPGRTPVTLELVNRLRDQEP